MQRLKYNIVMNYINKIIKSRSKYKYISIEIKFTILLSYLFLIVKIYIWNKSKNKLKFLNKLIVFTISKVDSSQNSKKKKHSKKWRNKAA